MAVDTFEAFQVWLYSQSLCNIEDPQDSCELSALPDFGTLARLWVFGDKYQIPLLQNCAIDTLAQKTRDENMFAVAVVATAYENTMVDSPLRKFAVDQCVFTMFHDGERSVFRNSNLSSWSKEAFVDVVRCMSDAWERKLPKRTMPERTKCYYHVHADGEHC